MKQEADNKTGPSLQIKKPSFALSHRAKALERGAQSCVVRVRLKGEALGGVGPGEVVEHRDRRRPVDMRLRRRRNAEHCPPVTS